MLIYFILNKSVDLSPVIADSEEGEDTGGDAHVGDKVVEATVERAKQPDSGMERQTVHSGGDRPCDLLVPHEDEGGDAVEGGDEEVGDGEGEQEIVGHSPHLFVS